MNIFNIQTIQQFNVVNDNEDDKKICEQNRVDKKVEVFISYNHEDEKLAKKIKTALSCYHNVQVHIDVIDIGIWKSIKKYMDSISCMNYVIFLVSDSFLKSENCLYEVLEAMRDINYQNKIFPVVIEKKIYNSLVRADYVIYWQKKFEELQEKLDKIDIQNLGSLGGDLKRRQNIAANIAEFLDCVSDMNNPEIENVCNAIEQKIREFI